MYPQRPEPGAKVSELIVVLFKNYKRFSEIFNGKLVADGFLSITFSEVAMK